MAVDVVAISMWLPLNGAWSADVHLATEDVPDVGDEIDLTLPGLEFTGRVARAERRSERVVCRVMGGLIDWQEEVDAKSYVETTAQRILDEMGVSTDQTVTSALPFWTRPSGTIGQAVQILARHLGVNWRCNFDGTVRVRAEAPATVDPQAVELTRDPAKGMVELAPELALVAPGVQVGADVVGDVFYQLEPGGRLRCRYWTQSQGSFLERFSRWATAPTLYHATYPCTVVRQAADGTLDLAPDDAAVAGTGLQSVPIRHGLPGCVVRVPQGTRVRLAFDGGDARRPYAALWDEGDVTEVQIGGAVAVALATLVKAELDKIQAAFDAHTHLYSPGPSAPAPTGPAVPLIGTIGPVESAKLRTE